MSAIRFAAWALLVACSSSEAQRPAPPPLVDAPEHPFVDGAVAMEAAPSTTAVADAPPPVEPPKPEEKTPEPWELDKQGDRIGSLYFRTWIWSQPMRNRDHLAIGAVRVGTTVKLKSRTPVAGQGCNNKWYEVEPHGFICSDATTTFDFETDYWKALASLRPGEGPYPYKYAFSMNAPMYSRIPTEAEQVSAERDMGPVKTFRTLGKWSEGHERLVTTKEEEFFKADGKGTPWWYDGTKGVKGSPWNSAMPKVKNIPAGSGFAYARVFEAEDRLWLLTPDMFLVPADRVWPYKESDFKGVELDDEHTLPLAWIKSAEGKQKLAKEGDEYLPTEGKYAGRRPVFLTGRNERKGKIVYWETKEWTWVADDDDVSVVTPKTALKFNLKEDERWLEASILGGTMTAFIGLKPVYTTMWSPGLGGVPVKGNDPKKFATTEVGVFPTTWKDKVELMSPDPGAPTVFWFADVPWIQYVHAPMAMHVAYWHDDFGYPMSAECLNTSAQDGEWIFNFTLPKLPDAWGSVGAGRQNGPSTKINITP
jgi:hypothetical protein